MGVPPQGPPSMYYCKPPKLGNSGGGSDKKIESIVFFLSIDAHPHASHYREPWGTSSRKLFEIMPMVCKSHVGAILTLKLIIFYWFIYVWPTSFTESTTVQDIGESDQVG